MDNNCMELQKSSFGNKDQNKTNGIMEITLMEIKGNNLVILLAIIYGTLHKRLRAMIG